jgi:hypothetical protein
VTAAEAVQGAPGGKKRFLRGVVRCGGAADHPKTEVMDGALMCFDERVKGIEVALAGAPYETFLHVRRRRNGVRKTFGHQRGAFYQSALYRRAGAVLLDASC